MSTKRQLVEKLCQLKENDFTKRIIMPLLRELGWDKVEFNGGVYEEGKDIICWRKDEWGDVELGAAQVKRYKPSATASDDKSFMELVNQIQQASEIEVPNIDGYEYTPSKVYCFTPYDIDTRALKTRFDGYSRLLKERGVKVIDGAKIALHIIKNNPSLVSELLGSELTIKKASFCNLNNVTLLNALNSKDDIDIAKFYCDLEFVVGNIYTRLFYGISKKTKVVNEKISTKDWQSIKASILYLEGEGFNVTDKKSCEIDEAIEERVTRQNELNTSIVDKNREVEIIFQELKDLIDVADQFNVALGSKKLIDETRSLITIKENIEHFIGDYSKIIYTKVDFESHVKQIGKSYDDYLLDSSEDTKEDVGEIATRSCLIINRIHKLYLEKKNLLNELSSDSVDIKIYGNQLNKYIIVKREELESKINIVNVAGSNISDLSSFLEYCETIFKVTDNILSIDAFRSSIGISDMQEFVDISNCPRLTIGLDHILDTGKNFALFGEAGAGKTTSLQMYARRFSESKRTDKSVIYIPLALALADYGLSLNERSSGILDLFVDIISSYFRTCGSNVSAIDVSRYFRNEKTTLLLDGIDEALMSAPWIPDAINLMTANFPKVQLVVSARVGMNYQGKIPFLGASLMAFTDEQRSMFIESWFKQTGKEGLCSIVTNHLDTNTGMGDLVRNPLLATILCILANNKVPLPTTEFQLYEERLRLLFGDYDIHKKISRVNSHRQTLEKIARKSAFKLHKLRKREVKVGALIELLVNDSHININEVNIRTGVSDLFSPCNILIPMNEDGAIGFGHLRYQEFLAAKELTQNRSLDIGPLLFEPWWKGVLRFYSQMADDIEHVFDYLVNSPGTRNFIKARDNMRAMLSVRPDEERENLSVMFEQNVETDDYEPY